MSICLRIIFAFVVALMWSAKGISSFAEGNTKLPPWYVEPKTRLPLQEYFADVEARVKRNWEPGYIFGNGDCEIHFTINPDGSFANIALIGGLGHPQTDFACVEAVSEASGFESLPLIVNEPLHKTLRLRPSERSVTCDCAKQFREINPRVSPQSIVWHLIPLEALQCCQTLSPDIVHSQKNLRLITNDLANGSEMSAARAEWAAFLHDNDNLTPEKITDEAERIERKYAAMFDRVPLGTDRTPENARLAYGYIDRHGTIKVAPSSKSAYETLDTTKYAQSRMLAEQAKNAEPNKAVATFLEHVADYGIAPKPEIESDHGYGGPIISNFSEGLARVRGLDLTTHREVFLFIDESGKPAFKLAPTVVAAGDFHEGLASVTIKGTSYNEDGLVVDGQSGFIDKTGHIVINPRYSSCRDFSDGLAAVKGGLWQSGLWGFIDKTGKVVVPYQFAQVGDFHDGLAEFQGVVRFDGKMVDLSDHAFGYQTISEYSRAYAKELEKGLNKFQSPRVIRFEVYPDYYRKQKPGVKIISYPLTGSEKEILRTKIENVVPPPIGILMQGRGANCGFTLFKGHVACAYTREDPQAELIMKRFKLRDEYWANRGDPHSGERENELVNLDSEINDYLSAGPIGIPPPRNHYR